MLQKEKDEIRKHIRERYAEIARLKSSGRNSCCSSNSQKELTKITERLGYSKKEINAVPENANMALGCGNPQAIAALMQGEVVLDLGSGGGFDCFLSSWQVGASGYVIGVDMTPDMISVARKNAAKGSYGNVEFRLGEIEHLPIADNSIDVIISNCVINLSQDKSQVFSEAGRVLRAGGRIAISDVVALKPLPPELIGDLEKHGGCVAGAVPVSSIEQMLTDAGFSDIRIEIKPESRDFVIEWFPGSNAEDYVSSATIEAIKKERQMQNNKIELAVKMKELIAIGASVAGHCQTCLSFHVRKAKAAGTDNDEIRGAIEVGRMVQKGAILSVNKLVRKVISSSGKKTSSCTDLSGKSSC